MYDSLDRFISLAPCPPPTAEGYKLFWNLVSNISLTQLQLSSITTSCGIKPVNDDSNQQTPIAKGGVDIIIVVSVIVPIAIAVFIFAGIYLWRRKHRQDVWMPEPGILPMNANNLNGTNQLKLTPYEQDNPAYSNEIKAASMDTRYQTADSLLSNHHVRYNSFDGDSVNVDHDNHSNLK